MQAMVLETLKTPLRHLELPTPSPSALHDARRPTARTTACSRHRLRSSSCAYAARSVCAVLTAVLKALQLRA
jgi:hypothetical protein